VAALSMWRRQVSTVLVYLLLFASVIVVLSPALYTLSLSFRTAEEVLISPPRLLPPTWSVSGYVTMSRSLNVLNCIKNTTIVAAATTLIAVVCAALAAYAFARFHFRLAGPLMVLLLVSQMFPGASTIVPLFQMLRSFGLYNTHAGLSFIYIGFTIPFCTWMLYGYFRTIPAELEEAALIDGSSRLGALFAVILPLALPGIAATMVFVMLAAWNEFTFAVLIIQSDDLRLITPGLALFVGQYKAVLNGLAAAAIAAAVPPLLAFMLVRRYFISGLVAGALKG
jgi:multiple sugar transport system permease protein